eukprot:4417905-Pyramimonas_sp.AAC.1
MSIACSRATSRGSTTCTTSKCTTTAPTGATAPHLLALHLQRWKSVVRGRAPRRPQDAAYHEKYGSPAPTCRALKKLPKASAR